MSEQIMPAALRAAPEGQHDAKFGDWISVDERVPGEGEAVLALVRGEMRIAGRFWDYPHHEDNYSAYMYWDDVNNDGQAWEPDDVTHWMHLPQPPAMNVPRVRGHDDGEKHD